MWTCKIKGPNQLGQRYWSLEKILCCCTHSRWLGISKQNFTGLMLVIYLPYRLFYDFIVNYGHGFLQVSCALVHTMYFAIVYTQHQLTLKVRFDVSGFLYAQFCQKIKKLQLLMYFIPKKVKFQ